MIKGVSVIIATFNGKDKLIKTLKHLCFQQYTCPYEIVLVDNASTDETKESIDTWWKSNGNDSVDYSSLNQPISGKSYALELGYTHAKYEYLLICDDDNWLCDTYVQTAFDIMNSNSKIGALGGRSEAVFEADKPVWFDNYAQYFAVAKQGTESGDITNKKGCLFGAGMVIRKSHWLQLKKIGFIPLLTCYRGNSISYGEDTEYSYVLRLLGYKMWYDDRLLFKHFMTAERMTLSYITKVRKSISTSNFIVSVYTDELSEKVISQKIFFNKFLRKVKNQFFKKIYHRLFGGFEQKELSKEYFRNLYQLLFLYKEYQQNRNTIKNWLPKNEN